ncbi:MAG: hypothetical protein V8R91_17315 [Butyricimonas faecihominis]
MNNDFQFKTETKFNQKNESTILGIGAYDVNHRNKGMKDPDDDQRYMLPYLPESVQWNYTIELPTNITGTVGTTFSYSAALPAK